MVSTSSRWVQTVKTNPVCPLRPHPTQVSFTQPPAHAEARALTQLDSRLPTDIKEAFALHDKRGNGTIASTSLGDVLRALGQNPTQKQVQDLVNNAPQESESSPRFSGTLTGRGSD